MERSAWPKNLSSSRKQAIEELLDGQDPTKIRHLFDAHSQTGNNTAQPLIAEDLVVNVLRSFSNTLSLSSSAAESYEVLQVPTNACVRSEVSEASEESIKPPPVPTNACVRSEVSEVSLESIKPPPVCVGSEVSEGSESIHTPVPRVLTAGRQLAKSLELQSPNDPRFSNRYRRFLQISEVVNSMKDLIDFCRESRVGPVEGLKSYVQQASAAKLQIQKMREMQQIANVQGLPTDRNTLNKLMTLHPGIKNHLCNNRHMVNRGALSGSAQAALALTSYQNMLMRENSMNTSSNFLLQEASSCSHSNQNPPSTPAVLSGSMQKLPVSSPKATKLSTTR